MYGGEDVMQAHFMGSVAFDNHLLNLQANEDVVGKVGQDWRNVPSKLIVAQYGEGR